MYTDLFQLSFHTLRLTISICSQAPSVSSAFQRFLGRAAESIWFCCTQSAEAAYTFACCILSHAVGTADLFLHRNLLSSGGACICSAGVSIKEVSMEEVSERFDHYKSVSGLLPAVLHAQAVLLLFLPALSVFPGSFDPRSLPGKSILFLCQSNRHQVPKIHFPAYLLFSGESDNHHAMVLLGEIFS